MGLTAEAPVIFFLVVLMEKLRESSVMYLCGRFAAKSTGNKEEVAYSLGQETNGNSQAVTLAVGYSRSIHTCTVKEHPFENMITALRTLF